MEVQVGIGSIIGFFVIVIVLGSLLHFALSKTGMYKRKVRAKRFLPKFLYVFAFLITLYILLLVIFGVIKLMNS